MNKLKCGAAERCVTPPLGLNIPQCMSLNPATGVKDNLYTHAVAVECDGNTAILISIDTSGLGASFARRVRSALKARIGIDPSGVMVSAIHIHTGGPQLMNVYWGQKQDASVTDFFLRETVEAAVEAYESRVPVTLRFGAGKEDRISFCRNYLMKDGTIVMNPGYRRAAEIVAPCAEIDYTVSTLRFDGLDGRPVAEIVNFACHPDTVGGNEYCADYPGEPFADIGLRLRERSPFKALVISELANDELGYFATEPAYSARVYEAILPSAIFEQPVIDRMIDTAAALTKVLYEKTEGESVCKRQRN